MFSTATFSTATFSTTTFSTLTHRKSLWVGCLVASVLMCLLAAPTSLEAQTAPNPSTSSGSSGEEGATSGPPPIDERDEDDVSFTEIPELVVSASKSEVETTEQGPVARFFATLFAGPGAWMDWLCPSACRQ